MTATARLAQRDRVLPWAIAVSVLLHVAVALLPQSRRLADSIDIHLETPPDAIPPLEFELVSPPPNPTPSHRLSRYLSTVSSQASDDVPRGQDDVPHGEGRIPIVDTPAPDEGAEGGGQSEVPPLPEDVGDLTGALQRSRFVDYSSPQREASRPEPNPEYRHEGGAAASLGGITISTTAWDFAPYLLDMKHRIKSHWVPPLAFTAMGAIHGYTKVRFRIARDGTLAGVEVLDTEGHESLHRASVNALRGAAPFRALPDDFPDEELEVTIGFYYLLPGDEERFFRRDRGSSERSAP